jgi:ATP-binding cassette subfamily B protein
MPNYTLKKPAPDSGQKTTMLAAIKKLLPFLGEEKKHLGLAFVATIINASLNLTGPALIGYTVDRYIVTKQYHGVLVFAGILLGMYLCALAANYTQTKLMGTVGQNVLFKLRNTVFEKLQALPVAFFNQNKAGDLISRINNDTDKLNQFFSQSLVQFAGNIFLIIGAAIAVLLLNFRLGLASLAPALGLLIFTLLTSSWVKGRNLKSLQTTGAMSAEIQESLNNFKVTIAFNRRDYFRQRFAEVNKDNFITSVKTGLANMLLTPVYDFASNIAGIVVLTYGIYLISIGNLTIGFLISFIAYVNRFYDPLRFMASLWTNMQIALAGWDRISEILALGPDLAVIPNKVTTSHGALLEFKNVHFSYPDTSVIASEATAQRSNLSANGISVEPKEIASLRPVSDGTPLAMTQSKGKEVLHKINFKLEKGKTYALVGPTGGGKSTTASIMARLYDPTEGEVFLNGRDIRSYEASERTKKIGFILQDPFLFTGTVRDNILYGNEEYQKHSNEELGEILKQMNLEKLLLRFDKGLESTITNGGESISLGQKQLIAFMRAALRKPELLILDEATANIDTVTEQILEDILKKLPKETTQVVIAHRLNTIENADEIFFVNSGEVVPAGSMEQAVGMLMKGKRDS